MDLHFPIKNDEDLNYWFLKILEKERIEGKYNDAHKELKRTLNFDLDEKKED